MNKSKVVCHLTSVIERRFQGISEREIEQKLMDEGWSIGAIRESIDAASLDRRVLVHEFSQI